MTTTLTRPKRVMLVGKIGPAFGCEKVEVLCICGREPYALMDTKRYLRMHPKRIARLHNVCDCDH